TLPGYEYAKQAVRWTGADNPQTWQETVPYDVHARYSLKPSALTDLLVPWSGANAEAFIGFVALAIVLLALCLRWHEPIVRLLACIAGAGFLMALGSSNLFHGIF